MTTLERLDRINLIAFFAAWFVAVGVFPVVFLSQAFFEWGIPNDFWFFLLFSCEIVLWLTITPYAILYVWRGFLKDFVFLRSLR